jgi:hypothetical protein
MRLGAMTIGVNEKPKMVSDLGWLELVIGERPIRSKELNETLRPAYAIGVP